MVRGRDAVDRGQLAGGVEGQLIATHLAHFGTVDEQERAPLVRGVLPEEGRGHLGGTEGVVDRRRGGVVVGLRVVDVEGTGRYLHLRVEVHRQRDVLGDLGRDVRVVDLQLLADRQHIAVVVHAVADEALVLGVDDVAFPVEPELPGAGVELLAVLTDAEETLAVDRQVEVVVGEVDVALGEVLTDGGDLHAAADRGRGAAEAARGEHVRELRPRLLEAGGGAVGDVVGDDLELGRGGVDAREGDVEGHAAVLLMVSCSVVGEGGTVASAFVQPSSRPFIWRMSVSERLLPPTVFRVTLPPGANSTESTRRSASTFSATRSSPLAAVTLTV